MLVNSYPNDTVEEQRLEWARPYLYLTAADSLPIYAYCYAKDLYRG